MSQVDGCSVVSVSELARQKSVSRQIISRQVKQLQESKLLNVHRRGRNVFVNPAEFDAARKTVADPARAGVVKAKQLFDEPEKTDNEKSDESYQQLRRDRERYEMQLKKLQLDRELGRLLPIEDVERAIIDCGHKIGQSFDQQVMWSEEIVAISNKGGVSAVRIFFRKKAQEQRADLARYLATAAAGDDDEDDNNEI